MTSTDVPRRGEIWLVALGAGRAGEPGKTRPALVISCDQLVTGSPEELIIVVPISSSRAPSALRVDLPAGGGVERPSRVICRAIRSVVAARLLRRVGSVDPATLREVEAALALILELDTRGAAE